MENDIKQLRILAVQRFKAGESPESICISLGKSRFWLYKWVKRCNEDSSWCEDRSCRPFAKPTRTPSEIEEIVKMVRLSLYNQDLFCGAQAILWEMEDLGARPLPSIRTINRIPARNELTHRRTRLIMPCPSLEARHIPVVWHRLSDSVCTTMSSPGSYQWPNRGETA